MATSVSNTSLKEAPSVDGETFSVSAEDDGMSLLTPDDYLRVRVEPAVDRCYVRGYTNPPLPLSASAHSRGVRVCSLLLPTPTHPLLPGPCFRRRRSHTRRFFGQARC